MMKRILLVVVCITVSAIAFGQATANQPTPYTLCDDLGEPYDGFTVFNLQLKDAEVLGAQDPSNFSVTYYETQVDADTGTFAIPSPYLNVANPQTIYVRVDNNSNGDFDTTTMTLRVVPNPTPVSPDPIALCDSENTGSAEFDLTVRDLQILNGENWLLGYYENLADAITQTNVIVTPTNYNNISNPQNIFIRVTNDAIPEGCFEIVQLELQVVDTPILGQPNNLYINEGDGDGMALFNLTVNDAVVAGPLANSEVFYFETEADATLFFNQIEDPASFNNLSNPQIIYVGLQNLETGCYSSGQSFTIATDETAPLTDSDNDGLPDVIEDVNNNGDLADDDTDGDAIPNFMDEDDDGDGTRTADEDYNNNGSPTDDDTNSNGIPDYLDEGLTLDVPNFLAETIAVYPNPAKNTVNIQWDVTTSVEKVAVFGLDGKLLGTHVISEGSTHTVVNLSEAAKGIYFIEISTQKGALTKKIIKN